MPARNFAPVAIGDEVATQAGSAVVQFKDGSDVVVQPKSRIRIEGKPAKLQVRVLTGSARTDLVPASRLQLIDSKGQTIANVLTVALPDATAMVRPGSSLGTGILFTGSGKQPGTVLPGNAISIGQFTGGTFAAGAGGTASIIGPNGITINVAPVTNSAGVVTGYTITSVTATVTLPNGSTQTITTTSGGIIGGTVNISGPATSGTNVGISITPPGSTTPLDPSQAGQGITNTIQAGINNDPNLPSGTAPPKATPVSTGQFSGSSS